MHNHDHKNDSEDYDDDNDDDNSHCSNKTSRAGKEDEQSSCKNAVWLGPTQQRSFGS